MALLWFGKQLRDQKKIGSLRAVFVHHHTRTGQDADSQIVQHFCDYANIPFKILHVSGLEGSDSNFENKARNKRRDLLLGDLKKDECLWMGHHLDDSHEWSLMQRYRSNSPKSTLGIPVRNGPIVRPFLCVSRSQLEQLVKNEAITFREDPSNADTKFDRNYIRHQLIPVMRKRYPQFLKHYAYLSNYLATIQNLNVSNRVDSSQIYVYENGAVLQGHYFSQLRIQELILAYSKAGRGEITSQIIKMLRAIDNGKKGPFHFSGRTEAYYSHDLLMIYNQGLKNYDAQIAEVLCGISDGDLEKFPVFSYQDLERTWENLKKTPDAMLNMPGIVLILESKSICKTLNANSYDSLFPKVSQVMVGRKMCFMTSMKCLAMWKRKKEKLPEKLRIIPLWSLSNLFV